MLNQLLPRQIDNTYRGQKLALWLFALVVSFRIAQSVSIIVGGAFVVQSADGVPLDTFTPAGAQTVVAVWALWALSRLFLLLLCLLTLVRYRSAIAFMFSLLLLHYLAGQVMNQFVPLVRTGTPIGPTVNLILTVLMVLGLALSLMRRGGEDEGRARAS